MAVSRSTSERNTYRLVFVRYAVDTKKIGQMPDTSEAVALGLRVRLASQGITGLSYLELDFVDPAHYPALDVPWQPRATYIPSMPSTFAQVQDAAQQVLAKLNRVDIDTLATQLTGLLTDLRADFGKGDVHQTLAEATALLRTTSEAVQRGRPARPDRRHPPDLRGAARHGAGRADAEAADQCRRWRPIGWPPRRRKLPPLIASVQATAQRAGNGTADLEQGLVPLLRDMQATAQNLREMTEFAAALSGAGVRSAAAARHGAGHDEATLAVGGRRGVDRVFGAAADALCAAA